MTELLDNLTDRNTRFTSQYFGSEFATKSADNQLMTQEFLDANEALGEHLYGSDIADLVRRQKSDVLNSLHDDVVDQYSERKRAITEINLRKIGMVVVRPELLRMTDDVRSLLEGAGLNVVHQINTQIDFNQYWALYGPGLADPDARYDFPTRTLNYINQDIAVLIATQQNPLGDRTVSEEITERLKGRQGSYSEGTLRGDLAFTALNNFVRLDGNGFIDGPSTMALDPIGAYRAIVNGNIPTDRSHANSDVPLLFYAGQGVHVPDDTEIARDLSVLGNHDDFDTIAQRIEDD